MDYDAGGPAGSTEVFATRIYKTTFINYDAGYGAAMSLSVCILALSVYFVLKFIQKRGVNRNDNAETQKNDSLYEGFFRSVNILDSDYADCCGGCEFV